MDDYKNPETYEQNDLHGSVYTLSTAARLRFCASRKNAVEYDSIARKEVAWSSSCHGIECRGRESIKALRKHKQSL